MLIMSLSRQLLTDSQVTGYDPTPSGLKQCLSGAEIVLIPAGVPRKPGMTRDGTFSVHPAMAMH
jgi:malate dehydrogenase